MAEGCTRGSVLAGCMSNKVEACGALRLMQMGVKPEVVEW